MSALIWFRNDLRVIDNESVYNSTKNHNSIIAYYNFNPKKSVTPYFGGGVVANFLSSPYKSPTLGLIAKGGFNLRIARNNMIIIELAKSYLSDANNNLELEPLSLKFGLSFILSSPTKQRFQNPNKSVKTNRLIKRKVNRNKKRRNKKRNNKRRQLLNQNEFKMKNNQR